MLGVAVRQVECEFRLTISGKLDRPPLMQNDPAGSTERRLCRLMTQPFDLGHRGGTRPFLDQPLG